MTSPTVVRPSAFHSPVRRTRLLLASLPIFAGLLSEEGRVLECNFGPLGGPLEARTDWIGRPFESGPWWNYSEESCAEILILLGRAQRGERVAQERLYKRPDGQMGVMMLSLTPLFAPYGQPDAILILAMDVTERRRERDTAEHIAHDMAHRLRNSFTIMRTLATRAEPGDPESERTLSQRLSCVRHSHNLCYKYLFFDVPIQDVVEAAVEHPKRLSAYRLDPINVPSDHVETLMLSLGELSRLGGQAELVGLRRGDGSLRLHWTEDEPREAGDIPTGLSEILITTLPQIKTGGTVQMSNDRKGFSWLFECPVDPPDRTAEDEREGGQSIAAA